MAKNVKPPPDQIHGGEHTTHATVMVVSDREWTPFVRAVKAEVDSARVFYNSRYQVAVYPPERPLPNWPRVVHLSIKHYLNIAITDFRDFQLIKNTLVGDQSYTMQVFPPESELVDTCNQYHLWCLVPDCWEQAETIQPYTVGEDADWPMLPFGFFQGRLISEQPPTAAGRQRTFDHEHRPPGLDELEAQMAKHFKEYTEMVESGVPVETAQRWLTEKCASLAEDDRGKSV